jgi:hypothetical protein
MAARRLDIAQCHVRGDMRASATTATTGAAAEPAAPIASTSYGPLLGRLHPAGSPPPPGAPFSAPGTVSHGRSSHSGAA